MSLVAGDVNVADVGMELFYEYEPPAMPVVLVPAHGSPAGGTRIAVFGEGFLDRRELGCRFSSVSGGGIKHVGHEVGTGSGVVTVDIPAVFVTTEEVHCLSPAFDALYTDEDEKLETHHALVDVFNHGWTHDNHGGNRRGLTFWYRVQLKVRLKPLIVFLKWGQ